MKQLNLSQPYLLLMLGYPGTGKSGLAKLAAEQYGFGWIHENRLRYELFVEPSFSNDEETIVENLTSYMLSEMLRARAHIIFDANCLTRNKRSILTRDARQAGYQVLTVWIQTDPETAYKRRNKKTGNDQYGSPMQRAIFDRYVKKLANPLPTEQYVVISAKHSHNTQLNNLIKKLETLDQPAKQRVTVNKRVKRMSPLNKAIPVSEPPKNDVEKPKRTIPIAPPHPTSTPERPRLDITRRIKFR